MRKTRRETFGHILKIPIILASLISLIAFSEKIADGIKDGFSLLGDYIVPSLFPFMLLSSYISLSPYSIVLSHFLEKPSRKLFNISGHGLFAIFSGMLGGYPIGAKTVTDFYELNLITKEEAHHLFSWCVNPGPSFVITATGTFLLNNTSSGIIMYFSIILASLTIGLFSRFTYPNNENAPTTSPVFFPAQKDAFINSVASASKAMLSICSWVLTFSAISSGIDCLIANPEIAIFIKSLAEVTTGCKTAVTESLPLPIICALLGFGGFAVIFQIAPYLVKCGYKLRLFICWRAIAAALSAFYCSQLMRLFPQAEKVSHTIAIGNHNFLVSHSITASIILLITCIVLILEVDNKKKVW